MNTLSFISEWKALASDPALRLRAVREYADSVFHDAAVTNAWLCNPHRSIRGGIVAVGAACQTMTGFFEAIVELTRIEQQSRQEALDRACSVAGDQDVPVIQPASVSSKRPLTSASVEPLRVGT